MFPGTSWTIYIYLWLDRNADGITKTADFMTVLLFTDPITLQVYNFIPFKLFLQTKHNQTKPNIETAWFGEGSPGWDHILVSIISPFIGLQQNPPWFAKPSPTLSLLRVYKLRKYIAI